MKKTCKTLLLSLLVLVFACAAAHCEETASVYDDISMTELLPELVARLDEPLLTEDGYYDFGGALVAAYESGRLRGKILAFDDIAAVAAPSQADFTQAHSLRQGASIESVEELMGGSGREIAMLRLSDEENAGSRRVLAWANEAGDAMEALFELDDGQWVLFAAVRIPAAAH